MREAKAAILIVDDEEIIRNLFIDLLQSRGYTVRACAAGTEALEAARADTYDVAFIDVHMPGLNGLETLQELKKISPRTVIVMTDSFPDTLAEKACATGAVTCIRKPFDIKQLFSFLEQIINTGQS